MIELTNPLTTEEKLAVSRLIGHDSRNLWQCLQNRFDKIKHKALTIKEIESAGSLIYMLSSIENTIQSIQHRDVIKLYTNVMSDYFDNFNQDIFLK